MAVNPSNFFCQTPAGSGTNENWGKADQALIIDLAAYLGSVKQMRNVALARTVNIGSGNVVIDQSFVLAPLANSAAAPQSYTFTAPPGNIATLVTSSLPIHLYLSTSTSPEIDLGPVTMLVLTSPITGLKFVNDMMQGRAAVKLVVV